MCTLNIKHRKKKSLRQDENTLLAVSGIISDSVEKKCKYRTKQISTLKADVSRCCFDWLMTITAACCQAYTMSSAI